MVLDSIQTYRLAARTDILGPVIEKAIKNAGSPTTASVYLELRSLALQEEPPFKGFSDKGALSYTSANGEVKLLTKEALHKRLQRRAAKGQ